MNEAKKHVLRKMRFECQKCGFCCSYQSYIYPSEDDIRKLARYLNISELSFAIRYLREIYDPQLDSYVLAFKTNHSTDNAGGCIFYQNNTCVIYDSSRTDLCKVFPWNHFDVDKGEWEESFVSNEGKFWCPGIGKGAVWTIQQITELKSAHPNFGNKVKRIYNKAFLHGINGVDVRRSPSFALTMSEEQIIQKLRSLSIEKSSELKAFLDKLYYGV